MAPTGLPSFGVRRIFSDELDLEAAAQGPRSPPAWPTSPPDAYLLGLGGSPRIGDTCICFLTRLMGGYRGFEAYCLHLFQRLHQTGLTYTRVCSLIVEAKVVLALALLWGGLPWLITLASFELLLGIWLDQKVAVPCAIASRS